MTAKRKPAAPKAAAPESVVTTTADLSVDGAADVVADETTKGSRDERHDSINPHTGALTEEALALRAVLAESK